MDLLVERLRIRQMPDLPCGAQSILLCIPVVVASVDLQSSDKCRTYNGKRELFDYSLICGRCHFTSRVVVVLIVVSCYLSPQNELQGG